MASFGWKRKVGEKVSKSVVQHFEAEAERAEDEDAPEKESVDWLHAIKKRRGILLEDCAAKSKRLKDEGAHLAEQGRWGMLSKDLENVRLVKTLTDKSYAYAILSTKG